MTSATQSAAERLASSRTRREALLVVLIIALLPFFFVSGPSWLATDTGRAVANLAHIPFFVLGTLLIHSKLPLDTGRRWLAVTAAIFLLSVTIELIQSQVGRMAAWEDVLRNLIGTWLVIFWLHPPGVLTWSGRVVATSLLTFELFGVASAIVAEQQIARQLPAIATFEEPAELERWSGVRSHILRSDAFASEGRYSLKGTLRKASFSGFSLNTLPSDWSGYQSLGFDLYNPQPETFQMTLRIHDAQHEVADDRWQYKDRYNEQIDVVPGWNHYSIELASIESAPRNRKMDLRLIRNLTLFEVQAEEAKVVYVDNFRLEP